MTVLTAIKYDGGVIVGADRLLCVGEDKFKDKSKIIIKNNYFVAIRGGLIDENLLSYKHPIWDKLEYFLTRNESYPQTIQTLCDFFGHVNIGQKNKVLINALSFIASGEKKDLDLEIHASFLCGFKYKGQVSFHYDMGYGEVNGNLNSRTSLIATPEEIDFTSEYVSSREMAYIKVLQRIINANMRYPKLCSGVEIVDFTSKNSELLCLEKIN